METAKFRAGTDRAREQAAMWGVDPDAPRQGEPESPVDRHRRLIAELEAARG